MESPFEVITPAISFLPEGGDAEIGYDMAENIWLAVDDDDCSPQEGSRALTESLMEELMGQPPEVMAAILYGLVRFFLQDPDADNGEGLVAIPGRSSANDPDAEPPAPSPPDGENPQAMLGASRRGSLTRKRGGTANLMKKRDFLICAVRSKVGD